MSPLDLSYEIDKKNRVLATIVQKIFPVLVVILLWSISTCLLSTNQELVPSIYTFDAAEEDVNHFGFQEGSIYSEQTITASDFSQWYCAILVNQSIFCGWTSESGDEYYVALPEGRQVVEISSHQLGGHACALLDNGSVFCWGQNHSGQIGSGSTSGYGQHVLYFEGTRVVEVAAGYLHTCAILENGTVFCWGEWGWNSFLQPIYMDLGGNATAVSLISGYQSSCAILDNHTVSCWGLIWEQDDIDDGITNEGFTTSSPVSIDFFSEQNHKVRAISGDAWNLCSISVENGFESSDWQSAAGHIWCLGSNWPEGQHYIEWNPIAISLGTRGDSARLCVILDYGSVRCTHRGGGYDGGGIDQGWIYWYNPFFDSPTSLAVGIVDGECILLLNQTVNCLQRGSGPTAVIKSMGSVFYDDRDADGDSVISIFDEYPFDPSEWADSDSDGVGDNSDAFPFDYRDWQDSDSDGYGDNSDIFPYDPNEWNDFDMDGLGDNSDPDDDNDGYSDNDELFNCVEISSPLDQSDMPPDFDFDLICDFLDDDDDDDGVIDTKDWNPYNPIEWLDTDSDGIGDNADLDDDNDLVLDIDDFCPQGETDWISGAAIGTDYDGDGCRDEGEDMDDDGDGVEDYFDGCPRGHTGWNSNPVNDLDGDGCHETEDFDIDGDGVGDDFDAFPEDPLRWESGDGGQIEENEDYTSAILLILALIFLVTTVVIYRKMSGE